MAFVQEAIRAWLDKHRTLPEARFVYEPWLNAGGEVAFVQEDIRAWLDKHRTLPEAQFVYKSWLDAGGEAARVGLLLPVDLETGLYRLRIGFYDPVAGARLSLPTGEDDLDIAEIDVQ